MKADLTDNAEFYPYSALYFKLINKSKAPFIVEEIFPEYAFNDFEDLDEIKWIKLSFTKEESESIRCGFSKRVFSYKKDNESGKKTIPIVRAPKRKTQEKMWEDMFLDGQLMFFTTVVNIFEDLEILTI